MEPSTTAAFIGALIVALIGAVGTWIWNRHKPQVDRNTTTIDGFDKFAQRLQDDNKYLHQQMSELRKRVATMEAAVATEKQHSRSQDVRIGALQKAVESWTSWGHWLHSEWSTIRQNERPPDLPKMED